MRLQKVLAAAGVASRRAAEQLITEGRVEVNGRLVVEQGRRIDPDSDVVRVDGSRIPTARRHVYLVLNKPRGVVSTLDDPEGRRDLTEFLTDRRERLFHVGRLDTETTGLLILTNDGEFAQRVAHPSYAVPKTYLAEVAGIVTPATLQRLRMGVRLEDGPVRPDRGQARFHRWREGWRQVGGQIAGADHVARRPEPDRAPYDGSGRASRDGDCPGSASGRFGWAIWRWERRGT